MKNGMMPSRSQQQLSHLQSAGSRGGSRVLLVSGAKPIAIPQSTPNILRRMATYSCCVVGIKALATSAGGAMVKPSP